MTKIKTQGADVNNFLPWLINLPVANQGGFDATGGSWTWAVSSTTILGGWITGSAAQNEYLQWAVTLAAGTYAINLGFKKFGSAGICHILIDGVDVGTIDMYNASPLENQWLETTGLVIPTSGKHTIKLLMSTKNVSSSNYGMQLSFAGIRRTA